MGKVFVVAVFFAIAALGCGTQQLNQPQSQSQTPGAPQSQLELVIAPRVEYVPAHPLPFKGKLLSGDPAELPPAVAMSLSDSSPVTFSYREEMTHDDYHMSPLLAVIDPMFWFNTPLGDIGVTAFATLSISVGDTIIGDYTAKEHASQSYMWDAQPTHKVVDDAARAAVRQRIDQKLYKDEAKLAQAAANAVKSTASVSR